MNMICRCEGTIGKTHAGKTGMQAEEEGPVTRAKGGCGVNGEGNKHEERGWKSDGDDGTLDRLGLK